MVEKTINLNQIELVEFLGVENKNITQIESAFPDAKIISRGNKIIIKGNKAQIEKVQKVISSLINKYEKYGNISQEDIFSQI